MAKKSSASVEEVTIINKTGSEKSKPVTYNLTVDGVPVTIKPGANHGFPRAFAEAIIRDLNKDVPGEENNPFSIE